MGNCDCVNNSKDLKEIKSFKSKSKNTNKPKKKILQRLKHPEKFDQKLHFLLEDKFKLMKESPLFDKISKEEFDSILHKNPYYKRIVHSFIEEINSIDYENNIEYENIVPIKVYEKKQDKEENVQYYQGCYNKGGRCHGYGIWTKDGDIYIGNFKNDEFSGVGLFINKEGSYYFGNWNKSKCNGKGKVITQNNLIAYEGSFKDNLKEGKGIENFDDGGIYAGNFSKGIKNGKGKFIFGDGTIFNGYFKESMPDFGIVEWPDGKKYKGKFNKGKIEGRGEYQYKNGVVFSGAFIDNKKNGDGEYKWPDGKFFQGKWKNDNPEGEGLFFDSNNQINEVIHYNKEGQIIDETNGVVKINDKN